MSFNSARNCRPRLGWPQSQLWAFTTSVKISGAEDENARCPTDSASFVRFVQQMVSCVSHFSTDGPWDVVHTCCEVNRTGSECRDHAGARKRGSGRLRYLDRGYRDS